MSPINCTTRLPAAAKMSRIKKILVASDLSKRTEYALARAFLLAGELNANLEALHVVPASGLEDHSGPPSSEESEPFVGQLMEPAQKELGRQVSVLGGKIPVQANSKNIQVLFLYPGEVKCIVSRRTRRPGSVPIK